MPAKNTQANRYADQVVESNCGYLSGYRKARPVGEQIAILRQCDWGRKIDWKLNEIQRKLPVGPVPQGSEGYFVAVFDQIMVTHYEEDPSIDQSGPVTCALNALSKQRKGSLTNHREGTLIRQYYRRNKLSAEKMKQLWESQECPTGVILIPAQLGIEHRGESTLRSRMVLSDAEFPLDAYESIQMVITHENRLNNVNDLRISLAGAEYAPYADGNFNRSLTLRFDSNKIKFDLCNTDIASYLYGSVSGFFPE